MDKRIIVCGYGNVGGNLIKLIKDKHAEIHEQYNINLILSGVIGSRGCIFEYNGLNLDMLLECTTGSEGLIEYGEKNIDSFYNYSIYEGDIFVDCTPSDVNGGVGLEHTINAINFGMDIVLLSKGAMVSNFSLIMKKVKEKDVNIKYSGATAAALPTMDIGYYSLAGCKINSIKGILNGTTNYILSKMHQSDISFSEALLEAQRKGIAEKEPKLDIEGIDSATKILILANSLMNSEYRISDINIKGIEDIKKEDIKRAKNKNAKIKLLAHAYRDNDKVSIEVKPMEVYPNDILSCVEDTNKGVVFSTDTMGEIYVLGGASNPLGAAAAGLKDIINLSR
ncbi:homoserine dehydrogenase [Clostridium peptidivorans]|uniref:homoserine dehydrogenase n=1 Tax=Clostridium peptidivorans TaxID=100174 RepID=UPI000BE470EB|nr:homoserine dehydrogenase [Clostridium peptidivorans]